MKITQTNRLLAVLSDGCWHTNNELAKTNGFRFGARIKELRARGYDITSERIKGAEVPAPTWRYKLVGRVSAN